MIHSLQSCRQLDRNDFRRQTLSGKVNRSTTRESLERTTSDAFLSDNYKASVLLKQTYETNAHLLELLSSFLSSCSSLFERSSLELLAKLKSFILDLAHRTLEHFKIEIVFLP